MTLSIGMSASGVLFLGSWGAGRVVASNMNELEQLIARPMQVELTAADIATLNADIATTTTSILRATQVANVLKVLGAAAAVATIVITLIQAASFGEQMKNEIQTLQTELANAKQTIAAAAQQLQTQKDSVLRLAAVVSGGLSNGGTGASQQTGIVVDPTNSSTSNVGQLVDDMVSLLTTIDADDAPYAALNARVVAELQSFNSVFPDCLTQVKASLETLRANIVSAAKLLSYKVPQAQVQQALSLTSPIMSAVQAAIGAGTLSANSQATDVALQLLSDGTVAIVPATSAAGGNAVIST
jgi:hypothetical protein